jgi:hypothetical protein
MPSIYVRTTAVSIPHQVSRQKQQQSHMLSIYPVEVPSGLIVARCLALICCELSGLSLLEYPIWSILNTPPELQMLSEAAENALAQSESTLLSSRGVWERLKVLRSTGEVAGTV